MLCRHRKRFYQKIFQFCYFLRVNLLFDQKIARRKRRFYRLIVHRRFCIYTDYKNATFIQQISFKSNDDYKRRQKRISRII